ncbi:hypothetical protein PoB_003575600 [Plakobranchus ocellatus]|uniref:Uncharacterized protein n=1 Tax=Plakobranchus ocellatus TaxID=259542 RepID=A0AAV4ADJ4_9GAST|nr:hypothetical protein PoB_003575600 [Plakobranchus ocellatus]
MLSDTIHQVEEGEGVEKGGKGKQPEVADEDKSKIHSRFDFSHSSYPLWCVVGSMASESALSSAGIIRRKSKCEPAAKALASRGPHSLRSLGSGRATRSN